MGLSAMEFPITAVDLHAIVIDFDNRFWKTKNGVYTAFGALIGCVRQRNHYAAQSLRLRRREPDGPNEIKIYSDLQPSTE